METLPEAIANYCVEQAKCGDLCIVLGAGASIDAGLPAWGQLAQRFARSVRGQPEEAELGLPTDPAWAIECLRGDQDEQQYRNSLREALYGADFSFDRATWPDLAIRHLASLAIECSYQLHYRQDRSMEAEQDASAVLFNAVTYNLDCLLELAAAKLGHKVRTLIPKTSGALPYEEIRFEPGPTERTPRDRPVLRTFHPHGILPLAAEHYESIEDLQDLPLVMAAEDYESRGGTAEHWQNTLQVAAFVHRPCLFYGFSFQDPSVRQLLKLAHQVRSLRRGASERGGHVAVLRRSDAGSVPSDDEVEAQLGSMGFTHIYWTSDAAYADQVAFLSELCFRVSGRRSEPPPSP